MINDRDTTFYNLPFKLDYEYIKTAEEAFQSFNYFDRFNVMGVDTETNGLDPYTSDVILLQLALPNGKVFVYDLRHIPGELFRVLLEDNRFLHILQNCIFDYKMMKANYGISINRMYDTMIAERCINLGLLNMPANLGHLVYKYLNYRIDKDVAAEFCDGTHTELTNRQIQYAAHDAMCLFGIVKAQSQTITSNKLNNVCKLEFEFSPAMADMELAGVLLDTDKWRIIIEETKGELNKLVNDILPAIESGVNQQGLFGSPAINLDSNVKLLVCLNNLKLGLENTSVGSLQACKHKHEAVPMLLKYRQLEKLLSSFGETILEKIHAKTGRLHPTYNQMVSTGRLSCRAPNLQQIPGKSSFRSCFIAKPGYKMITNDMSQAELRILACYSKDPVFIEAYKQGKDLHTATACGVYNVTEEEVVADSNLPDNDSSKKDYRKNVKSINFGLCLASKTDIQTTAGLRTLSYCEKNDFVAHDVGFDRIIDHMYMGEKEVFEVVTKYGYSVQVTSAHNMQVIDINGDYVSKPLNQINIDKEMVCIKAGSNLFPTKPYMFKPFEPDNMYKCKYFKLPTRLTKDIASLLGLFVAEGGLTKVKHKLSGVTFGFATKDKKRLKEIYKLLKRIFGSRLSVYGYKNRPAVDYRVTSSMFAYWVVSLFDLGPNKTKTVHIPDCIKQSPRNTQICFLKWLFEGDGTIKRNNKGFTVSYCTISKRLIKDVQLLLLNFGIISSILPGEVRGREYYTLNIISNKSNKQFIKDIGFVMKSKNDKYTNTAMEISYYFVANQQDRLKKLKQITKNSRLRRAIDHAITRGGSLSNKYLKDFSKDDDLFKFIYDNNIITLPIVSIESKGVKPVYDISIENRELFLANGFVVHNCYGMSKYGLSARLGITEDAAEDMINKYFQAYSGVKRYLDRAANDAVNKGYSTTISGRRRYYTLPDPTVDKDERRRQLDSIKRRGKNTGIQGCFVYNTNVFGAGMIGENVDKMRILSAGKEGSIKAIGQYSGKQEVYKLTTNMGFTLVGTFGHPITVKSGKYDTMVSLGETKGMSARMVSGKYKGFPINIENMIKRYRVIAKNNYITSDLGFILGCLYDSGYFESRQKLFYVNNKTITDRIIKSCSKHFRSLGNISKYNPIKFMNKGSKIYINFNESIKNLLYHLLYDGTGKIGYMSYILNSPAEVRESFVSGFLGCRSRIDDKKQKMAILCSNDTVAFTVQQLLLSLGIIAFKEVGHDGDCQLEILDDFVTNAGKLVDDYGMGLGLYTPMPDLEFYDTVVLVEKCGIEDTYDFVSGDAPHMYVANGFKVSNSNADVLKKAIINVSNNIKKAGYDAETVLTVHDEVVVEVREDQAEDMAKTLSKSMIDAWDYFFTDVPMVSDSHVGNHWEH